MHRYFNELNETIRQIRTTLLSLFLIFPKEEKTDSFTAAEEMR